MVVTGGAGFIGSHVVEALLARGDEVHVLDNLASGKRENIPEGARFHDADIRSDAERVFDEARPEGCFHLAAQASEDAPRRPLAPYGTAKLAAEEYLATYNRLYGTSHVVVRYANVYGPRQEANLEGGVVSIFMRQLAAGETPKIFGDGTQTRDFVYVGDTAAATLKALEADGGVFNVGTGIETSVNELYEAVRRASGVEREPEYAPPRPGELSRSVLDPGRAERKLGWRPEHDLDRGLAETWAWVSGD